MPVCRDCDNWRPVEGGQCRANSPLVLPLQATLTPAVIAPAENAPATRTRLNFISYWPPVRGEETGCGQFKAKFSGQASR